MALDNGQNFRLLVGCATSSLFAFYKTLVLVDQHQVSRDRGSLQGEPNVFGTTAWAHTRSIEPGTGNCAGDFTLGSIVFNSDSDLASNGGRSLQQVFEAALSLRDGCKIIPHSIPVC